MILAGDIGGTKTVLALFEIREGTLCDVRDSTFVSREHASLESILGKFLDSPERLDAACFGVAGPVVEGKVHTTNLPWVLDTAVLQRALNVDRVKLLNDLEATAYGMLHLDAADVVVLHPGASIQPRGNIGVIAAGTGLGEAMLYWDGQRHHPMASEGGHADFAPRSDGEIQLLQYLRARFGHVSYERVLSGPGLFNVYSFLRDRGTVPEGAEMAAPLSAGDPNAVITDAALHHADPLSTAALELFCSLYGAEAGNLALRCVALGGVFVAGGIAPKIVSALAAGGFMRAFLEKGRFADLLGTIAVHVAMNPRAPMLGAAHMAWQMCAPAMAPA